MTKLLLANAVTMSVRRSLLNHKANEVVNRLLADDGDEANDRSKLKVLNDGDGVRLLMSIYQDYVSDDDYVKFPDFMYNVDSLLYKARGNKALTREEREEMEEATPKRGKRKKPKQRPKPENPSSEGKPEGAPSTDATNTTPGQITANDLNPIGSFFSRYLTK